MSSVRVRRRITRSSVRPSALVYIASSIDTVSDRGVVEESTTIGEALFTLGTVAIGAATTLSLTGASAATLERTDRGG